MVPGVSWALSDGTLKGTEFLACSVCPFKPTHRHRPRSSTMVARVLSSVITGGRAPYRVPAPLPLSHHPSVRWTYCCFLCRGFVFHSYSTPSAIHPLSTVLHRCTSTTRTEHFDLVSLASKKKIKVVGGSMTF